jgi:type I restriction enzyme, S subunit
MTEALEAQVGEHVRRWKPYPAYKDSGVEWLGEIPRHWDTKRLKDVSSRSAMYGANEASDAYQAEGVRFIRTSDISEDGSLLDANPVYVDEGNVQHYLLMDGDLLLSRSGTIGRSFVFDEKQYGRCAYAGYLVRFKLGSEAIPRFVFYFTKSLPFLHWLSTAVIESTIGNVNGQKYAAMPLPIPPVREQEAIDEFLTQETAKIDALIEKKHELIHLLNEARSARMDALVRNHQGDMKRLKFVALDITSGSRGWAEFYDPDASAAFLRIGNVRLDSIELQVDDLQFVSPPRGAEAERTKVQGGDVVISITANVGAVGLVPRGFREGYVNQHLALLKLDQALSDPAWIATCLSSELCQQQFAASLYGGIKDGLALDDVLNVTVPLPPKDTQARLVVEAWNVQQRFVLRRWDGVLGVSPSISP